ncbi:MAG: DUF1549 and DUF1553 domain-containing protein [Verrucomicrobiales bacterium]|nr:DUF1549 and DUF1553 domain-containing protein [Verrucomicrobiales bacterium]
MTVPFYKNPICGAVLGFLVLFEGLPLAKLEATEVIVASDASKKIDSLIEKNYQQHKVTANAEIRDEIFLRRIYLDVIGRIPSLAEAQAFNESQSTDKRSGLIRRLLNSEGFVSHNYNYWADILRINARLGGAATEAEAAYRLWVKSALRENKPYDQFVKELVSARGHLWENGAIGYYQRDRGMPLDNMSNTVRIFLGTRLECAQCHDHPFDKWSQMDYFKMAAFTFNVDANRYTTENRKAFNKRIQKIAREQTKKLIKEKYSDLDKKEAQKLARKDLRGMRDTEYTLLRRASQDLYRPIRYTSVSENKRKLLLPHDYQYDDAKPKSKVSEATMFGGAIDIDGAEDKVEAYADWMTSSDNPTFTKVIANRLWKRVFGVGILGALDELTDQTVNSNPALMSYLEDLMRDLNYDTREYLQILYNSKTYQRTAFTEEIVAGVPYYFPGPALRRMTAEQVWDSLMVMLIDDTDHYQPRLESDLNAIERQKQIYESLEDKDPDEYLKMIEEVVEVTKSINVKEAKMRKAYQEARSEEDVKKSRSLGKALGKLRREAYQAIADVAYDKVSKGEETQEMMANLGMSSSMMNSVKSQLPKTKRIGKKAYKKAMKNASLSQQEKKAFAVKAKKMQTDARNWSRATKEMARASELQSPAKRGHFLREFGQSDRETIENANYAASVPQALNLLNGPTAEMLRNVNSVFGQEIEKAVTAEAKINTIYMTMLTRKPTDSEMKKLLLEIESNGEKGYDNIVWALLNTQQFIFVL